MAIEQFRGTNGWDRGDSRSSRASSEIGTDALRGPAAPGNSPLTTLRGDSGTASARDRYAHALLKVLRAREPRLVFTVVPTHPKPLREDTRAA